MAWPRTIQARLTIGYAVAFFVGLVVFSIISFTSLASALKAVVDARLASAATSVGAILSADPDVDHSARERLDLIIGSNLNAAVFSSRGKDVYSSVISTAPAMRALILRAGAQRRLATLRTTRISGRVVTQRIRALNGSDYYVGVWRQLDLVDELERLRMIILGTAALVIGAGAVLVGSLIARQGLRPLHALAALASEIEAHDLSRRLGVKSDSTDLGRLAATFDRMLGRLEEAFERQRRFTADASHELRAPLAVVHTAAELALRRDRDPATYRRVLDSIFRATKQLEALTDSLLAAARADAGHVDVERIDLSTLLAEVIEQLMPLAESKGVRIDAALQPLAFVNADRGGLLRAAVALVDNAIKYSPKGGMIATAVEERERRVRMTVRDDGPGFSAEGLRHATDRFWRNDAVRVPGSGFGLGLAICDSIVRASGGTLVPQNAAGHGALILLEFPAAT